MKFKIGDRVISHCKGDWTYGKTGTVKILDKIEVGVVFDNSEGMGHNLNDGHDVGGSGWWMFEHQLKHCFTLKDLKKLCDEV